MEGRWWGGRKRVADGMASGIYKVAPGGTDRAREARRPSGKNKTRGHRAQCIRGKAPRQ